MSTVTPSSENRELTANIFFELQRHLILNSDLKPESYPLGKESDFFNTAVKIEFNEILREFQESNFAVIPQLKERRWIVLCASNGVYPIYHQENLNKFVGIINAQWKVLKISKDLYKKLLKNTNIKKRIIYTNLDAMAYNKLSDKAKEEKYYPIDNITAINRKEGVACCGLL